MHRTAMRLSAAVLALVCGASALHAQTPGSFGVAGGLSVPIGDLGDRTETGYHIAAVFDFSPPLAPVGLRFDGFYNNLSGAGNSADLRTIAGTGALTFGMGGIGARPYFLAGAGVYNTKADVDNAEGTTSAGVNVGLGVKFSLTGFSTFAEARAHYLFKKRDTGILNNGYNPVFIPITFGILF
jgi:hypothetical protein